MRTQRLPQYGGGCHAPRWPMPNPRVPERMSNRQVSHRIAHSAVDNNEWSSRPLTIFVLTGCSWGFGCSSAPDRSGSDELGALDASLGATADAAPHAGTGAYTVERSFLIVGDHRLELHLPVGREVPVPSVLIFHSAMGKTESVLEWSDRLAQAGFAAVVLDFYDGKTATTVEDARKLRDAANDRSAGLKELVKRAWFEMENDGRLRSSDRFLLGWSFGGAWATFATDFLPGASGVVALYGQAFTGNEKLYDVVDAPVLFVGGERDTAPAPGTLREIVKQLESRGKQAALVLVPAGHAFAERTHPGFDADADEEAWQNVIKFLRGGKVKP